MLEKVKIQQMNFISKRAPIFLLYLTFYLNFLLYPMVTKRKGDNYFLMDHAKYIIDKVIRVVG